MADKQNPPTDPPADAPKGEPTAEDKFWARHREETRKAMDEYIEEKSKSRTGNDDDKRKGGFFDSLFGDMGGLFT